MPDSDDKLEQMTSNIGRLFESQVLMHESISAMKSAYEQRFANVEDRVDALLTAHIRTEDELLTLGQHVEHLASSVQMLVDQLGGRGNKN